MALFVLTRESESRHEPPTVAYAGNDGDEFQRTLEEASAKGLAVSTLKHPLERFVQHFDRDHPALKTESGKAEMEKSEEAEKPKKGKK